MSEIYWGIYKLLNDPPGTPKDLKCVGCKVAAGGLSLSLAGACLFGLKRGFKKGQYRTVIISLGAFCLTSSSLVLFRLAYDNDKYNKQLIKDNAELVRSKRREVAQSEGSSIQQNNQS